MLTQDQKQERNTILTRMNYNGNTNLNNLNAALMYRLKKITEQTERKQGRATFGPTDEGSAIFWGR